MTTTQTGPVGVAEAHRQTLIDLQSRGILIDAPETTHGSSRELLGYQTAMTDPRSRLVSSSGTLQNVLGSVARFVWLIAGSDRLEDIAFYEGRVHAFSDDGLVVPGSSYGRRLFNAAPGLNQVDGVVEELKRDQASRRAAAVVWLPEDAVRPSNDIPCTFGLFFHIREGELIMTTVMRSNNAFTLLPYNFFEFSMLGEMVAAEVGVPFGRYVHWAASMHIFDSVMSPVAGSAVSPVEQLLADTTRVSVSMPLMPVGDALKQGRRLAQLEASLRHAATTAEVQSTATTAEADLNDYWLALFRVLQAYVLAKHLEAEQARAVVQLLPDYLRSGVNRAVEKIVGPATEEVVETALFDLDEMGVDSAPSAAGMVAQAQLYSDDNVLSIARMLPDIKVAGGPASVDELLEIVRMLGLGRGDVRLAARSAGASEAGHSPFTVDFDDVERVFRQLRSDTD